MNRMIVIVAIAIIVGLGLYFLLPRKAAEPEATMMDTPVAAQPAAEPGPSIQYPVQPVAPAEVEQPAPLPELGPESDITLEQGMTDMLGTETLQEIGLAEDFIRRFVVTVDNLPRQKLPLRLRPIASTPGSFVVGGDEDDPVLSPENYERYDRAVVLFAALPSAPLVALYTRNYSLFQEAYVELGYPDGYFNDRLIEVIDQLLVEPPVEQPVRLVRPHVMYKFADPELEALSPGQKVLIRVGPANARLIRDKLRELRDELTSHSD